MIQDLVSVIISTYNAGNTIEQCVAAVLMQDYPNVELIIVDDCSFDDTVNRVAKYNKKLIINETNSGISYSRNAGARVSSANILIFLDSDVVIQKNGVSSLVKYLLSEKNIKVVAGKYSENTQQLNFISDYKNMDLVYRTNMSTDYNISFTSFFFAIRKADFMAVHGFTDVFTGFTAPSAEDTLFAYKLSGGENLVCLKANVFVDHLKTYSLISMLKTNFARIASLIGIRKNSNGEYNAGEGCPIAYYVNIFFPSIILLSFLGVFFKAYWLPILAFIGFTFNNHGFLMFLVKKRGCFFAFKSLFILFIEYVGVFISILISLIVVKKRSISQNSY